MSVQGSLEQSQPGARYMGFGHEHKSPLDSYIFFVLFFVWE